jgi:hypothetical protein
MIIKIYLITYYYLLEIIKLREKMHDFHNTTLELNSVINRYNKIISPYMEIYNKNIKKQKENTHVVKMKPIGLDLQRLCEKKLNINYDDIKHLPANQIFMKILQIIKKRNTEKILNSNIDKAKPIIKLL